MSLKLTEFAGVTLPTKNVQYDFGLAAVRSRGATINTNRTRRLLQSDRQISLSVPETDSAWATIRSNREDFAALVGTVGTLKAQQIDNNDELFMPAELAAFNHQLSVRSFGSYSFVFRSTCNHWLGDAYGLTGALEDMTGVSSTVASPRTETLTTDSESFTFTNSGTVETTWLKIRIVAKGTDMDSITISNVAHGYSITYAPTAGLLVDEVHEIDCESSTVLLDTVVQTDTCTLNTHTNIAYMGLHPGANTIAVQKVGGDATTQFSISYHDTYL